MLCLTPMKVESCDKCQVFAAHAGPVQVQRTLSDDPFLLEERIWSIPGWNHPTLPDRGDLVSDASGDWRILSFTYSPPCAMVIRGVRPILACPDGLATIYNLEGPLACLDESSLSVVAAGIPVALKHLQSRRRFEFDAEICEEEYEVWVEGQDDLACNLVIEVNNQAYKVESVRKKANMLQPVLLQAVQVPWPLPSMSVQGAQR